jgi:hypothetical protein
MNNDFGTLRPGGAPGTPGMLTVAGNYTQTQYVTLMIQIAGANPDQFSVLNVLGTANLNGFLDPSLLNGFVPAIGDSFVFLNYTSFTGAFSHIKHQVFDNGTLQWSVIYEGNHAILTVGQYVPDQGSTFWLYVRLAWSGALSATVAAWIVVSIRTIQPHCRAQDRAPKIMLPGIDRFTAD